MASARRLTPSNLGLVLRLYRRHARIGLRTLASEMDLHFTTLGRIERGEAMDGETLRRIQDWLWQPVLPEIDTDIA